MNDISKEKRKKWESFVDELTDDFVVDPRLYIDLKHYALNKEFHSRNQDVIIAILDLCLERARKKRKESEEIWRKFPDFA